MYIGVDITIVLLTASDAEEHSAGGWAQEGDRTRPPEATLLSERERYQHRRRNLPAPNNAIYVTFFADSS